MKIVVTNNQDFSEEQKTRLESLGDVTYYDSLPDGQQYLERVKNADIICSGTAGLKEVYNQLKDVYITVSFVSVAFVNLDVLTKNNVRISNAPGINRHAVSEWIIWAMLLIARDFNSFLNSEENYRKEGNVPPLNPGLTDKNLTILGNGNISKQLARLAKAFDMNITVFKRGDDLHESVVNADYIVNALSSSPTTYNLLNEKFFSAIKEGASFIDITRAEITDQQAMLAALDSGKLNKVATDCGGILVGDTADELYRQMLKHPNVIATPHISYNSEKSAVLGNDVMIDNVEAWIKGKPQNLLN